MEITSIRHSVRQAMYLAIFTFFFTGSITYTAFGQGAKVIPDGLDCKNLTKEYESYREYCNELGTIQQNTKKISSEVLTNTLGIAERIAAFKKKGWEKIEQKDYDGALIFFRQALEINKGNTLPGQELWLAEDRRYLSRIIEAAEKFKNNPELIDGKDAEMGFWMGQGFAAKLAEEKQVAEEKQSKTDENAPWYNIKYECYGTDRGHLYKGLEILQVVKNSTPDYLDIEVRLRFNDLHPKYHRNIFIDKYTDFNRGTREDWLVLVGAADKPSGTVWTSPATVRIPRSWSLRNKYTATWDDSRQRYRLSNWEDEYPYNRSSEIEMFGVHIECYQHDPEPKGQDQYSDSYDGIPEENILREW